MLRDALISGKKVDGLWQVKAVEVEQLRGVVVSVPVQAQPPPTPTGRRKVDAGMVEVTMALASIAAAVATFLPNPTDLPDPLRVAGPYLTGIIASLAGFVAALSAYGALWLLARYCVEEESVTGFREIRALLFNPRGTGPFWLVSLSLLVWLILSLLVGALAVVS
jgi:hypothetical protein